MEDDQLLVVPARMELQAILPAVPGLQALAGWEFPMGVHMAAGPVLTVAEVLSTPQQKQRAFDEGSLAVEMEAGPLAQWAAEHSLPFIHLRVVLDGANTRLAPLPVSADGEVNAFQALLFLLRHPGELPEFFALLRAARRAQEITRAVMSALASSGGPLAARGR